MARSHEETWTGTRGGATGGSAACDLEWGLRARGHEETFVTVNQLQERHSEQGKRDAHPRRREGGRASGKEGRWMLAGQAREYVYTTST